MEAFDEMLKEMAEKEEIIVPNGFDERMKDVLDSLPAPAKKGLGAVKITLIAVAACIALLGTAFAASPALQEMVVGALGNFAPYAQEQQGEPYVIDGIEFRVVSVLADDFTVQAYVEARELEGNRLSKLSLNTFGRVLGLVDIPKDETDVTSFGSGGMCLDYDEETKTALLAITTWGQVMPDDLSGSTVRLSQLSEIPVCPPLWSNSENVAFPVEIEPVPSVTMGADLAAALRAEEVRLSSLSLSIIFNANENAWYHYSGTDASVTLTDGTVVEAPWVGGQGSYGEYGTPSSRVVLIWNFQDPVDVESIESICVAGEQFFLQ